MQKLKIYFTDFWPNFEVKNNIFYNLLKEHYDIEITDKPDYLFYSVFGTRFRKYNCTRIFFTGENVKPDFRDCDYSFSFDMASYKGRNLRLPHYYQFGNMEDLTKEKEIDEILKTKTKFCNFIYSNPSCRKRNEFFRKLSKYKKVDSAGRYLNNIGGPIGLDVLDKWNFLKPYKFTIAFENEEAHYYTSEKIYEAMKVNSIPIYWGNPLVNIDFNTKSFLNYYDYGSDEDLIDRIIEIDRNDDLFIEMLKQPYFENNQLNKYVRSERILEHFRKIFDIPIETISEKSGQFSKNLLKKIISNISVIGRYKKFTLGRRLQRLHPARIKIKLYKIRHKQKF